MMPASYAGREVGALSSVGKLFRDGQYGNAFARFGRMMMTRTLTALAMTTRWCG